MNEHIPELMLNCCLVENKDANLVGNELSVVGNELSVVLKGMNGLAG